MLELLKLAADGADAIVSVHISRADRHLESACWPPPSQVPVLGRIPDCGWARLAVLALRAPPRRRLGHSREAARPPTPIRLAVLRGHLGPSALRSRGRCRLLARLAVNPSRFEDGPRALREGAPPPPGGCPGSRSSRGGCRDGTLTLPSHTSEPGPGHQLVPISHRLDEDGSPPVGRQIGAVLETRGPVMCPSPSPGAADMHSSC